MKAIYKWKHSTCIKNPLALIESCSSFCFHSSRKVFQSFVTQMQDLLPFRHKSMSELRHDIGRWGLARSHVPVHPMFMPVHQCHHIIGHTVDWGSVFLIVCSCLRVCRRHAALTCVAQGSALENRVFHPSYHKADRPSSALSRSLSLIIAPKKTKTKKLNNCLLYDWSLAK